MQNIDMNILLICIHFELILMGDEEAIAAQVSGIASGQPSREAAVLHSSQMLYRMASEAKIIASLKFPK